MEALRQSVSIGLKRLGAIIDVSSVLLMRTCFPSSVFLDALCGCQATINSPCILTGAGRLGARTNSAPGVAYLLSINFFYPLSSITAARTLDACR